MKLGPVIDFKLDQENDLKLILPERPEVLLPTDYVDIWYYHNDNQLYLLHRFWIEYAIEAFNRQLKHALENKLHLHESINKDIGYMWNEHVQDRINVVRDLNVEGHPWVGNRYILFSPPGGTMTWLYNDAQGQIILEINPSYFWHFREPEEGDKFIEYDEFIRDYKPILITTISRETATEWLRTTQELMDLMYSNEQQWLKEAKEQSS